MLGWVVWLWRKLTNHKKRKYHHRFLSKHVIDQIILAVHDGYSYRMIAECHGISPSRVGQIYNSKKGSVRKWSKHK